MGSRGAPAWPCSPGLADVETDIPERLPFSAAHLSSGLYGISKGRHWKKERPNRSGKDTDFKCFLFHFAPENCVCVENEVTISVNQVHPSACPREPVVSSPVAGVHQMPGQVTAM